jgi:uncharacterized protein (DUF1330 family)
MTVYMIADIKLTDDKWVPAYAASVHNIVHKHGGKYLARSGNLKSLESKPLDTSLIALLAFPSAEAVRAFLIDPEYAPYAAARQSGSEGRFQLIDDTDLAVEPFLICAKDKEQASQFNFLSIGPPREIGKEQTSSATGSSLIAKVR